MGQVPKIIKYEFLVRTYNGDIATNQPVNIRASILDGSTSGSVVYAETHNTTTDRFGMLSLQIGSGADKSGDMARVDWSKGDYYLKMDELGGKNLMLMPTQKLLSVPYALFADKAGNVDDADADPRNELQVLSLRNDSLSISNGNTVNLGLTDNQTLQFHDGKLFISGGNNVALPMSFSDTSAINELQKITKSGNVVTLSQGGGSFTDDNTVYTAGEGIAISGTQIENTAPSQWVKKGNTIYMKDVSAGIGTENPSVSAALDVSSTRQGFLPPRMTTAQRNAIQSPEGGLIVFNTESGCLNFYSGVNWVEICGSCTPQPTKADAGTDQTDMSGSTVTLSANTPGFGEGRWSIVSGTGGRFTDERNPRTTFTGSPGTTYVLRWSISNDCGASVDDVTVSFWSCGFAFTDTRDGKTYGTIKIGNQCWMAQNLNHGTMINGANMQGNNRTIEKYCYDDNAANCDKYGALYQWDEAVQYMSGDKVQGVCPPTGGWHVPSDAEWKTLVITLGIDPASADKSGMRGVDQGTRLKEGGLTGFNALLGGSRLSNGSFFAINNYGNFWSSTPEGINAWRHAVSGNTAGVFRTLNDKKEGLSVRCVKD
jgi:uncharacterized protein (TIGR02145 family)